jgi:hypothetical protein
MSLMFMSLMSMKVVRCSSPKTTLATSLPAKIPQNAHPFASPVPQDAARPWG